MLVNNILSAIASLLRLHFLLLITFDSLVHSRESCYNNGTLKIDGKKISCICQHPYTGKYCEDYACVNGLSTGLQYDPNNLFFNKRCLCDPGWTGVSCSSSLINRCGEHGSDVDGICECKKNFVGDRCQYVTRCINGQLYNGRCACHYGWRGDFCDQIICHQGYADTSNRKCVCPPNYRGDYCDFCAKPSSSSPPECAEMNRPMILTDGENVPIILAVVITIIMVVVGALFYFLCYKISDKKKAAEKARQSKADIENGPSNSGCESCPLNGAVQTQNIDNGFNLDSEKFYDHPPPSYETLTPVQKEQNVLKKDEDKMIETKRTNCSNRNNEDRTEVEVKFSIATPKFEQKTHNLMDQKDATHHSDVRAKVSFSEEIDDEEKVDRSETVNNKAQQVRKNENSEKPESEDLSEKKRSSSAKPKQTSEYKKETDDQRNENNQTKKDFKMNGMLKNNKEKSHEEDNKESDPNF